MSTKQLRWHDTLALMNVDLIHKLGRDKVVPDVLSRREEFHAMSSTQALHLMYKGKKNPTTKDKKGVLKRPRSIKALR